MVHGDDPQAPLIRDLIRNQPHYKKKAWQEMPRIKRQQLMEAAYSAEQALALQIAEAKQTLSDHSEIRRSLPKLKGEVRSEARQILNSNEREVAAANVRAAFNASRDAWHQVPTFIRHKHWDSRLKKQALKVIKELS